MTDELRRVMAAWMEDAIAFGIEELCEKPLEGAEAETVESPSAPAEPSMRPRGGQASATPNTPPPETKRPAPRSAPPAPAAAPPRAAPLPPPGTDSLERIADEVAACKLCALSRTRTRVVPGQGAGDARIMFVGEAPGAEEDQQGLAFVGAAGKLLTNMIGAMGFDRDQVFIANVLKCRPPGNRDPRPQEVACCLPFLKRQIALVRPDILIALGGHAMKSLLCVETSVGRMRGRIHDYEGTPLVVTYHPAYLLRSPEMKRAAWDDLKGALAHLGLTPPPPRPPAGS